MDLEGFVFDAARNRYFRAEEADIARGQRERERRELAARELGERSQPQRQQQHVHSQQARQHNRQPQRHSGGGRGHRGGRGRGDRGGRGRGGLRYGQATRGASSSGPGLHDDGYTTGSQRDRGSSRKHSRRTTATECGGRKRAANTISSSASRTASGGRDKGGVISVKPRKRRKGGVGHLSSSGGARSGAGQRAHAVDNFLPDLFRDRSRRHDQKRSVPVTRRHCEGLARASLARELRGDARSSRSPSFLRCCCGPSGVRGPASCHGIVAARASFRSSPVGGGFGAADGASDSAAWIEQTMLDRDSESILFTADRVHRHLKARCSSDWKVVPTRSSLHTAPFFARVEETINSFDVSLAAAKESGAANRSDFSGTICVPGYFPVQIRSSVFPRNTAADGHSLRHSVGARDMDCCFAPEVCLSLGEWEEAPEDIRPQLCQRCRPFISVPAEEFFLRRSTFVLGERPPLLMTHPRPSRYLPGLCCAAADRQSTDTHYPQFVAVGSENGTEVYSLVDHPTRHEFRLQRLLVGQMRPARGVRNSIFAVSFSTRFDHRENSEVVLFQGCRNGDLWRSPRLQSGAWGPTLIWRTPSRTVATGPGGKTLAGAGAIIQIQSLRGSRIAVATSHGEVHILDFPASEADQEVDTTPMVHTLSATCNGSADCVMAARFSGNAAVPQQQSFATDDVGNVLYALCQGCHRAVLSWNIAASIAAARRGERLAPRTELTLRPALGEGGKPVALFFARGQDHSILLAVLWNTKKVRAWRLN